MDIQKIYEYALAREHEGKRFFETNAERMSHAAAVGAFRQLAGEEQKHIDFINLQIDFLRRGESSDASAGVEMERAGFFTQRASSAAIDQTVSEAMVPDLPILRMAYLIERDFAEFYEMAAQKADGEARQVLSMLANWERGHERYFKDWHDKIFNDYANMPWGG
jgi:rubrerythrin